MPWGSAGEGIQYLKGGEGPRHAEPIRGTLNYADLLPKGLIATVPRDLEETAIMTCNDMWSTGRQGVGLGDLRGRWGALGRFAGMGGEGGVSDSVS